MKVPKSEAHNVGKSAIVATPVAQGAAIVKEENQPTPGSHGNAATPGNPDTPATPSVVKQEAKDDVDEKFKAEVNGQLDGALNNQMLLIFPSIAVSLQPVISYRHQAVA